MADPLYVVVTGGGQQWDFRNRGGCPSAEKVETGDGPIRWTYDWVPGTDVLPPRHAIVELYDDIGLVQTGILMGRQPPPTDDCAGPCSLAAFGLSTTLGFRKFTSSVQFGPQVSGQIALTLDEAVIYTMTQIGMQYVNSYDVPTNPWPLSDSENFIGRPASDTINSLSSIAAGTSTPFVWQVRNRAFSWRPLDTSARYQVLISQGAVVQPVDDADRLYNHVIVIWGNNQAVQYPETVSYTQLPSAVSLVVNAGTEAHSEADALRLAEGIYARLETMELGWSYSIKVPFATAIEELGVGFVHPWRVPTMRGIRIPDLEGAIRYGPHQPPGNTQLITSASWNGDANELMLRTGEPRDPRAFVRRALYSGASRTVHSLSTAGLSTTTRDADKTPLIGGQLTDDPHTTASGKVLSAPIGFGTGAYSKEHSQYSPKVMPPMPVKVIERVYSSDGGVFTAGLLNTGEYSEDVPACRITDWSLSSSVAGTLTIQIHRAQKNPDGSFMTAGSGDDEQLVPGALVGTVFLTSSKFNYGILAEANVWRIPEESRLIYTITGTPASCTMFTLRLTGKRIAPGFPVGHQDFD